VFAQLSEAEPGTFYLTDFLLRHYERLVVRPLGLDRHLSSRRVFRHYKNWCISRRPIEPGHRAARQIADSLGFCFEYRYTGYGELGERLHTGMAS